MDDVRQGERGDDYPIGGHRYNHERFERIYRELLVRGFRALGRNVQLSYRRGSRHQLNGGMIWTVMGFSVLGSSGLGQMDAEVLEKVVRRFVWTLEVLNVGGTTGWEEKETRRPIGSTLNGSTGVETGGQRIARVINEVCSQNRSQRWNDYEFVAALEGIQENISTRADAAFLETEVMDAFGIGTDEMPSESEATRAMRRLNGALFFFRNFLLVEARNIQQRDWLSELGGRALDVLRTALIQRVCGGVQMKGDGIRANDILPAIAPHIMTLDSDGAVAFTPGTRGQLIEEHASRHDLVAGINRFIEHLRATVAVGRVVQRSEVEGLNRSQIWKQKSRNQRKAPRGISDHELIDLIRHVSGVAREADGEEAQERQEELRILNGRCSRSMLQGSQMYEDALARVY